MKNKNRAKNLFILIAAMCLMSVVLYQCSNKNLSSPEDPEGEAKSIIDQAGIKGGFIVHLNCGEGTLTEALRLNDSYRVHGLDSKSDNVRKAREYITSKGNYGPVSVDQNLYL